MITLEALLLQVRGLRPDELERWVGEAWVRPDGEPGRYLFRDIDVARVRLILELRDGMQVNEEALPVVLQLLDRLHAERRRMRRLRGALERAAPDALRDELARLLRDEPAQA